jgi:hypothetical protein
LSHGVGRARTSFGRLYGDRNGITALVFASYPQADTESHLRPERVSCCSGSLGSGRLGIMLLSSWPRSASRSRHSTSALIDRRSSAAHVSIWFHSSESIRSRNRLRPSLSVRRCMSRPDHTRAWRCWRSPSRTGAGACGCPESIQTAAAMR